MKAPTSYRAATAAQFQASELTKPLYIELRNTTGRGIQIPKVNKCHIIPRRHRGLRHPFPQADMPHHLTPVPPVQPSNRSSGYATSSHVSTAGPAIQSLKRICYVNLWLTKAIVLLVDITFIVRTTLIRKHPQATKAPDPYPALRSMSDEPRLHRARGPTHTRRGAAFHLQLPHSQFSTRGQSQIARGSPKGDFSIAKHIGGGCG